jgi:hypothetical protein
LQKIVTYALKPMVTSVAFLTPNAARVQAQLSHKSALGSKKFWLGGGNFFHPPKTLYLCGVGGDFFVDVTSYRYGEKN